MEQAVGRHGRSSYARTLGRADATRTLARRGALQPSGSGEQEVPPGRRRSPGGAGGTPDDGSDRHQDEPRPWSLGALGASAGMMADQEELALDEQAAARRCASLAQLASTQRRALDALSADRAALEAALGVAQRRFKAELDARRGAEAAALASATVLADERARLAAARAAYRALLSGADGASGLAAKLASARAACEDDAHELVAQRALTEDAAHELEGCEGRVRWECALEREALAAAHAQQAADLERALARTRAELDHVTAQQHWELERMRAAAELTAGVADDALGQADARKRELEGVNDALGTLSEALYVGSMSMSSSSAQDGDRSDGHLGGGGRGDSGGAGARQGGERRPTRDDELAARAAGRGAAPVVSFAAVAQQALSSAREGAGAPAPGEPAWGDPQPDAALLWPSVRSPRRGGNGGGAKGRPRGAVGTASPQAAGQPSASPSAAKVRWAGGSSKAVVARRRGRLPSPSKQ